MESSHHASDSREARLLDLTLALNSTMDPDQLLDLIIERATNVLDCEAASLMIYDEDADALIFMAATGVAASDLKTLDVPIDSSLAGAVFRENSPVIIDDATDDARHFERIDATTDFETRSLVGVPMTIDGVPTGVLEGINKRGEPFNEHDVQTLSIIAAQAAIALRNARQLASLRDANETLQELDTLKTQIMSIASHELRTPLTTILGYAEMLREESSGQIGRLANYVVDAGQRMREVIETMSELLDLLSDRVDAVDFRKTDPSVVIDRVVTGLEAGQRDRVAVVAADDAIAMHLHEKYLERALQHLIGNALKYSDAGSPVRVSLSVDGGVRIEISDQGIGLAPDELERIFEAFYQVEHHLDRSYEGLGLGLTYAREVARLHGGRLRAVSDGEGKGSRFAMTLSR